jgi:uncharacterized sulfatase
MPTFDRRTFLKASAAAALGFAGAPLFADPPGGAAGGGKPNLVVILADDLLWYDLGCTGNTDVATPQLDGLAGAGMQLNNMHATTSLCSPCRAETYTGMYPHRNGITGNGGTCKPGTRSLAHHLKPLGYQVVLAGKSHVGPAEVFPWDATIERSAKAYRGVFGGGKPFCLVAALHEPHGPFKTFAPKFDPQAVTLPEDLPDTPGIRKQRCGYYTAVEELDRNVGVLLAALEAAGKADDTLVLFVSEHGAAPNGKRSCWESGVKAAAMARWPGRIKAGTESAALMQYADILPTFVTAAGAEAPAAPDAIDGQSFLGVLLGETESHRERIFHQFTNPPSYPIRAVREGPYKLIANLAHEKPYAAGLAKGKAAGDERSTRLAERQRKRPPFELYHLDDDPWEFTNLAGKPEHAKRIAGLKQALAAWMEQQGDPQLAKYRKMAQRG